MYWLALSGLWIKKTQYIRKCSKGIARSLFWSGSGDPDRAKLGLLRLKRSGVISVAASS